jgi:hypothetical protein
MESFDTWSAATGLAVIVATSAFGCGMDDPDVGLVVIVGRPRNVIELDQAAGRAGRDGKTRAECLVLVPVGELHCHRRPAVASVSEELAAECHPVARGSSSDFWSPGRFLADDYYCRRAELVKVLDADDVTGLPPVLDCMAVPDAEFCDCCVRRALCDDDYGSGSMEHVDGHVEDDGSKGPVHPVAAAPTPISTQVRPASDLSSAGKVVRHVSQAQHPRSGQQLHQ